MARLAILPIPVRPRWLSAAAAALGLAAMFALTLVSDAETVGAAAFTLWIAWLALEFGIAGGLIGALAAAALVEIATELDTHELDPALIASRGLPFVGLGLVIGALAERLRASEFEHKTLVEQLPLATYVEPLEGGATYVSPQIEEIAGYPPERWVGGGGLFEAVLHRDDRDRVLEEQRRARERREPLSHEYRLIRADGGVVHVKDRSVVLRGRWGRWQRQGFAVDITAETNAERQRQLLLAQLQALIDSAIDGICMTDREGNPRIVNRTLGRLTRELGMSGGRPVHEQLLAVADQFTEPERFRETMRRLAAEPDAPSRDEFEHRQSGRVFVGYTQPVVDGGEFVGRVWTLRDVTEDRELTRLHDEFLSTVSHELRTPLTSISGFLELLAESEDALGDAERGYLATVERNVGRLRRLVDDLLLMRQVGARQFSIQRAPVDLTTVAAEAVEAAGPAAQAKEIALGLEQSGAVPVVGDRARLAQVADNLIGNAVKFTPAGGRVDVRVAAQQGHAVLVVSDDGVGIPASQRSRLFDPFFRASSAIEHQIPGTGLGLSIVKAIVDAHEGTLGVESEPGRGSTFTVELRLAKEGRN